MSNDEFKNVRQYTCTMLAFKKMYSDGLISLDDYSIIETNIAEKYGLISSVLYRIIIAETP